MKSIHKVNNVNKDNHKQKNNKQANKRTHVEDITGTFNSTSEDMLAYEDHSDCVPKFNGRRGVI